jgi:methylamine--corrinoid protein Co-methyltransferase
MVVFSEVIHRALNGPFMREKDFEQKLFMTKIAEVVKEYDIRYDEKAVVPSDDDLADRVFQAALDLYTEIGTYCLNSQRIIRFSQDEISEALRERRKVGRFGEGVDARVLPVRRPESEIPPWCSVGAGGGAVSSEAVFQSLMRGYAQIPLADSITTPSLMSVDGVPIRGKTPLELEGSIRTVLLSKEAISQAGRPGIPIVNWVASAATDVATIGADHFGLLRSDAWEVSAIAEMKVDFSLLNKVAYLHRVGGQQWGATAPIMGGYAGGPEGTAVAIAAYNLQVMMINQAEVHHPFTNHISYTTNTGREMLWVVSVSSQAITRNSPLPAVNLCYTGAGPMTEMCFYEVGAWTLASVVSGASIEVGGIAKNTALDHTTPYEPQFGAEVAHGAVGMSRKEANRICLDLVGRYEKDLHNPPTGKRFQECFDIQTSTPTQEYRDFYKTMKKKIHKLGVPLGG